MRELTINCVSNKDKKLLEENVDNEDTIQKDDGQPAEKKQRLSKKEKKKLRGQNKKRPITYQTDPKQQICHKLYDCSENEQVLCERNNCHFLHDVNKYLEIKPKDIGNEIYNILWTCYYLIFDL